MFGKSVYVQLFVYSLTQCVQLLGSLQHVLPTVAECPLMDELCNINTQNIVEGCFFYFFFNFVILIFWPLYILISTERQIAKIG